jgi:hypothetical protein
LPSAKSTNGDATDRRLRLLIGLAVVLACGAAGVDVWFAVKHPEPLPNLVIVGLICVGVSLANHFRIYVRVRSSKHGIAWGEVPILLGLLVAPMPWVVLAVAVGVASLKIVVRAGTQPA